MKNIESTEENNVLLRLVIRIVLPCLPIFVERIVAYLTPELKLDFPNRDVLVIAFLIPIVWVIEIKNKTILLFSILFIILASIPFICSFFKPTTRIFISGLYLAISAIVLFTFLEITNLIKSKLQKRQIRGQTYEN